MLQARIEQLFQEQTTQWELARKNFSDLQNVRTRRFHFEGFDVVVQFNPARIASSGAKTDAKAIAARKCFLCQDNLPAEQEGIAWKDYTILVNPFPVFPEHFTIPRNTHTEQTLKPCFADMLELAQAMSKWVVFYNGPRCGASAPDHMHFQAGTKDFLPLLRDYRSLPKQTICQADDYAIYTLPNYLRTVYCIETADADAAQGAFEELYEQWQNGQAEEPMMNIVCSYDDKGWQLFILPRKLFRPWQYTAEPDKQLLISPATVEMAGVFITPIEAHFERITADDIRDIYTQITLKPE